MATKTAHLELTNEQRTIKSNIRNAWFTESATDIRFEAMNRAAGGRWFEATVLLELALEVALGE